MARLVTDGPAAAAVPLRRAVDMFTSGAITGDEGLPGGWMAATALWDADAGRAIITHRIRFARAVGLLEELPVDLIALAYDDAWRGNFDAAAALMAEADAIAEVTGSRVAPFPAMFLAALRGDQAALTPLVQAGQAAATTSGQGPRWPARAAFPPCWTTDSAATPTRWPRPSWPPRTRLFVSCGSCPS